MVLNDEIGMPFDEQDKEMDALNSILRNNDSTTRVLWTSRDFKGHRRIKTFDLHRFYLL